MQGRTEQLIWAAIAATPHMHGRHRLFSFYVAAKEQLKSTVLIMHFQPIPTQQVCYVMEI
mgnify:FL=1